MELREVTKHFPVNASFLQRGRRAWVRAVDGVSFTIDEGQTLALVGESGSGKTTTARMILRLLAPTSGSIWFRGRDLAHLTGPELKTYRRSVQAVFQDPWGSLNPRQQVRAIVAEPLLVNGELSRAERESRVAELLSQVGLRPEHGRMYPHQFSGGQRQRIAIARALSVHPRTIVLDEPVSALDVSIRAQILNLLKDLQERLGLSYLLIAHNLATVRYMSHRVAVMYLGQIVEMAASKDLFDQPLHPYTQALYAASLSTHPGQPRLPAPYDGDVPSPSNPPSGCRYHPRCPLATARDARDEPALKEVAPGHWVRACRHTDVPEGAAAASM